MASFRSSSQLRASSKACILKFLFRHSRLRNFSFLLMRIGAGLLSCTVCYFTFEVAFCDLKFR